MRVAGGVYVERCASPFNAELLGSGGRAALALSSLSTQITLDTFAAEETRADLVDRFVPAGIDLRLHHAASAVEFHYLHSLARPRVQPMQVEWSGTVEVRDDIVLRFGCMEGDFRCIADTAVYDPQSSLPVSFHANGSEARRVALVANLREFETISAGRFDPHEAQRYAGWNELDVVVVKAGPAGAWVITEHECQRVPAYRSRRVGKIGSGDVFGAAFAHWWGVMDLAPADAADRASRHVADYVENQGLPLRQQPLASEPACAPDGKITATVVASGRGMLADWLIAEAETALRDAGVEVALICRSAPEDLTAALVRSDLLIALTVAEPGWTMSACAAARKLDRPTLALVANPVSDWARELASSGTMVRTDLAKLAYDAAWAAAATHRSET